MVIEARDNLVEAFNAIVQHLSQRSHPRHPKQTLRNRQRQTYQTIPQASPAPQDIYGRSYENADLPARCRPANNRQGIQAQDLFGLQN